MRNFLTLALLSCLAVAFVSTPAFAESDNGEKLFKRKCASCHKFDKHAVGPMLQGVIGRKAGSTDYGKYRALADADFTWDETKLDGWLADPKGFIGKNTSMAGKIKDPEDRAAIIEYLKSQDH